MHNKVLIAPSILSADFCHLGKAVSDIEQEADILHLDIMDGHYVPNLSIGPAVIRSIRQQSKLFLETHLMISNPEEHIQSYAKAGSDRLVLHPDTCKHLYKAISEVKNLNLQCALAINPSQDIDVLSLEYIGDMLSSITVMTVNPGFGGQKFLASCLKKIEKLKVRLNELSLHHIQIEVDGGVNLDTASSVVEAGADILVAGSAVYNDQDTPASNIQKLKKNLQ